MAGGVSQSIWLVHGRELPSWAAHAYRYQEKGLFWRAPIEMPRGQAPQAEEEGEDAGARVGLSGREYAISGAVALRRARGDRWRPESN